MKNRLIGIVFIFMLLAGCVSQQPNSSSIDTVEKSKIQTLHMENNIYGKSFTAKGNYQLTNILNLDNGNNIVYTDFESKNSIFLCSNLECTHNTEVCESFIKGFATNIFVDNNKLVILYNGGNSKNCPFRIEMADLDGSNRKQVYQCSDGSFVRDTYLICDNYIFLSVTDIIIDASILPNSYILRINISTGKQEKIYDLKENEFVTGAIDDMIAIKSVSSADTSKNNYYEQYENVVDTIFHIDIDGGRISGYPPVEWKHFEKEVYIIDDYIYSFLIGGKTISRYSPITGETKEYANAVIENFEYSRLNVCNVYGDNLIYYAAYIDTDKGEETRVSKLYSLNLDTGKTEVNTLQFLPFDERKKITILAEYEDYFLVNNGMETVKFLRQSKREYSKNEIVEDIVEVSINSLILKSDYFTSNENYMNVENRYLQDCKESVQP